MLLYIIHLDELLISAIRFCLEKKPFPIQFKNNLKILIIGLGYPNKVEIRNVYAYFFVQ